MSDAVDRREPALPPAAAGGRQHVRLAMYLAFVILAVGVLALGWNALRLESARAADAEILDNAALQRTFSQQIGRIAALVVLDQADPAQRSRDADALSIVLTQQAAVALTLNDLLQRQLARADDAAAPLRAALDAWEAQRERLWYRTELLLRIADSGELDDLQRSAAAVQAETAPALSAANQLSKVLRAAAEQRAAGLRQQFTLGGAALLALMLVLALAVVEPTARSVQRHARRLAEQATELQRLALVAEHTSALVVERLSDNARTDALTRLPNRAVVMDRLQQAVEHARRHPGYGFAVLFMDFDRFKQVNDTLGHGAGDELLRQIARRLALTVRPGDALARLGEDEPGGMQVAARLGGDEFVVVLDGVNDAATAGAVAQRLLEELAEPYLIDCQPVHSSASIGVVLCSALAAGGGSDPALTAEDLLRNADTAMVEAKRAGRGRWVLFDDSMHERLVRAQAVENDLRNALKDDELFVVYQPVVDLPSQAMLGVEALVRWRHPTRGLVGPVEFIGVAEECGLIDAVGGVVLRKACTQFMAWQRTLGEAAPRLVAVNLSRAQLERAGLVDEVREVLQQLGMAPALLQLEVTESLAAQDESVQTTLRELKSLGVRLALDDFGTGYSSLACLHQMPVDTVKVDRSFVKHAETVEYHRVLIEATIRVARTLGMTTVAEGIETEGQADLMRQLDCDRGQGFLFSKPLAAPELERWALAHAARLEARAA